MDNSSMFSYNKKRGMHKFKVVLLGDQMVGKTSVLNRFAKDQFDQFHIVFIFYQPTIGIDFSSKTLVVQNKTIRIQLWDTAGQQRFKSLIPSYLKDSNLAIIVVDLTSLIFQQGIETLKTLDSWIDFVKESRGQESQILVAGNKCDLSNQRMFQKQNVQEIIKGKNIRYIQISAKKGINIQKLFIQSCCLFLNIPFTQQLKLTPCNQNLSDQKKQTQNCQLKIQNITLKINNNSDVHTEKCNYC